MHGRQGQKYFDKAAKFDNFNKQMMKCNAKAKVIAINVVLNHCHVFFLASAIN